MSIVLWYAVSYSDNIFPKEYVKETESYAINALGVRDKKITTYSRLFKSEHEAREWVKENKKNREEEKRLRNIKEAARDLLEALEDILSHDLENDGATEGWASLVAACTKARAAIAKAKGEQA